MECYGGAISAGWTRSYIIEGDFPRFVGGPKIFVKGELRGKISLLSVHREYIAGGEYGEFSDTKFTDSGAAENR